MVVGYSVGGEGVVWWSVIVLVENGFVWWFVIVFGGERDCMVVGHSFGRVKGAALWREIREEGYLHSQEGRAALVRLHFGEMREGSYLYSQEERASHVWSAHCPGLYQVVPDELLLLSRPRLEQLARTSGEL